MIVADFGLCMDLSQPVPNASNPEEWIAKENDNHGTPSHASPDEQLTSGLDIFALGITVYQLKYKQNLFMAESIAIAIREYFKI